MKFQICERCQLQVANQCFLKKSIRNVVKPLLKYAHHRGIYTQMNSNLTLHQDRYLDIAEYIDVMHISHNWGTTDEFANVGFGAMKKQPPLKAKLKLYEQMISNARTLSGTRNVCICGNNAQSKYATTFTKNTSRSRS